MSVADRPAGLLAFVEPAVQVQAMEDGSLLLRSPHALRPAARHVLDWLLHWAEVRPGQTVLAERDGSGAWRRVSYRQALDAVRALATALCDAGASSRRPLAILSENSIEQALLTWAAMYAGVPVAPISPAYALAPGDLARLRGVLQLLDPWLVFAQDGDRHARALHACALPPSRLIVVDHAAAGMRRFEEALATPADPAVDAAFRAIDASSTAKLMFTSGSTGRPKGVVMTHAMLAATQEQSAQILLEDPQARPMVQVDWLPWHHVMGGNVVMHRLLRFGGTLYIDDGRPTPARFARTVANLREVAPTYYFNVPAGYAMLVAELERDASFARHFMGQLGFAYFSGAALPEDVHRRLQAVALKVLGRPLPIGTAYAATETTAAVTMRTWHAENLSSIGTPMPGVSLKLLPDRLQPGRYEMRVKAPGVMREYLHAPEATEAAFDDDGWYCVGDAVRFASDADPAQGLLFAGRIAEDFKLGSGTWVRTAALRARLLEACAPLLRDAVLAGEGRATVGALAWIDAPACRAWLGGDAPEDEAALRADPRLHAALSRRLATLGAPGSAATQVVAALLLLAEPPSLDAYELTDKGSLNARALLERRAAQAERLFAPGRDPEVIQPMAPDADKASSLASS